MVWGRRNKGEEDSFDDEDNCTTAAYSEEATTITKIQFLEKELSDIRKVYLVRFVFLLVLCDVIVYLQIVYL